MNNFWFSELIELELGHPKYKAWLEEMGIKKYTFNPDGTVDIDGDVDLGDKNLTKIPVKFGKVSGLFKCSHNRLTTLEGSPREVGEWFNCSFNQLTTLEGCPGEVEWSFYCSNNAKKFTKEEVRKYCEVKEDILV